MNRGIWHLALGIGLLGLAGCDLAPDFKLPEINLPMSYKEQPAEAAEAKEQKGMWQEAKALDKDDRGQWWKIFSDEQLNDLEKQAADANQTLKIAAARVQEARATAQANTISFLPDIDVGANAVRAQPANAGLAAFGQSAGQLKPYTLYEAQGVANYEVDLFGQVRNNYRAYEKDADAQEAAYRTALLALQADVAQNYFSIRELDAERKLLRDTIIMRQEAARIMDKRYQLGDAAEQDKQRTQADLAEAQAELAGLDRQRSTIEHGLAVLLGKMPSEFMLAEAPLAGMPPEVPAGLPSTLLERRPDVASAQASMAAANLRIGVARAAFYPNVVLTASGGFESTVLHNLFQWSNRTWALGQLAGTAISMPIFDNGRNQARLDLAHAQYEEAVAGYRQQVLVAFRDVEDNLAGQRLLAEQAQKADVAAASATRTTELTQKRYKLGDANYFEVVTEERNSLAAERAAVQTRGQRFITTVALIRALGGSWEMVQPSATDAVYGPEQPHS